MPDPNAPLPLHDVLDFANRSMLDLLDQIVESRMLVSRGPIEGRQQIPGESEAEQ